MTRNATRAILAQPVFRHRVVSWLTQRGVNRRQPRSILGLDPVFGDNQFRTRTVLQPNGARFTTRTKAHRKPTIYHAREWDVGLAINEGVLADLLVGFDGAGTLRLIRYRDPESGTEYEFLTSVNDFAPGLIALLHWLRWRIERVFDTGKTKLQELKGWAVGDVAQDLRAHFFALTHNPPVLLRRPLNLREGFRQEKVEKKPEEVLKQRKLQAAAHGRRVAAVQSRLAAVVQLTAQFIRAVRHGIIRRLRGWAALAPLRAAMKCHL